MKTLGRLALCAVLHLLSPTASSQTVGKLFVYGTGTNSCGKFIEDRGIPNGSSIYSTWISGYLTAVNVYDSGVPQTDGRRDIRQTHDPASLVIWMEKFCRENPLATVTDAAITLVVELRKK
jgi:hypothetical protein